MGTSKVLIDENFYVMEQFASFGRGTKLRCIFYEDHVEFRAPGKDAPAAQLSYRYITDVFYGTKSEIVKVNTSTLARAIIGKNLLGSLGAQVGMVSSLKNGGQRSKQVVVRALVMSYSGKDGKIHIIALQTKDRHAGEKAEQLIRSKIGKPPQEAKQ